MFTLVDFFIRHTWFRFILAGGTSAFVDLTLLFILYEVFAVYYLFSAIIAFIGAFGFSFTLHKYWTFKSHEEETQKQVIMYLGTQLFGLFLNTLLMYAFVDIFGLAVMLSQLFVGGIVAFVSFFIARNFVFKQKEATIKISI
ncbi:MAG: GtrA family protein [Minisyncoccia bacterium]